MTEHRPEANRIPKVFISYSSHDRERIRPYLDAMEALSVPYWWDRGLHAGRNFSNEIAQNIKDNPGFVLFLSSNSANSWFVEDELTYACNNRKQVITVCLEGNISMPAGMEMHLCKLQKLDGFLEGPEICAKKIAEGLQNGSIRPAEPIDHGKRNHLSDLLGRCRKSLLHLANQMNVHDFEKDIDPALFCPIFSAEKKERLSVDLYSEICREDHTHILLQADGGYGKTYTFLHTMMRLLDCDRPCAYIPCCLFGETENRTKEKILKKLCSMYLPESAGYSEERLNDYFTAQTDKAFILFLDGYNEAVDKEQLSMEINNLSGSFPDMKIVISSRYSDPVFSGCNHYTMTGLNMDSVASQLREYGQEFGSLHYSLQKLLMTPMFLRMYLRLEAVNIETDTAAELMDRERLRVLEKVHRNSSFGWQDTVTECLDRIFPDFVRTEYLGRERSLSFFGSRLRAYLRERLPAPKDAEKAFRFLTENSIILKADNRTDVYAYQHEHYRDYWVAYSIFRDLMKAPEAGSGTARAQAVTAALSGNFSGIVLRYVGELAGTGSRNSLMGPILDCLRHQHIPDDTFWAGALMADASAKVIQIHRLTMEERLVGLDLDGLNLSEAQLNEAQTCTRKQKTTFRGSLISERTFIASFHESAPRRVELMRLEGRDFLVSLSNIDLLISALPEMDQVWRYPHADPAGGPVSTHTLTVSASLEDSILAVDTKGAVWEWRFGKRGVIPFVSPVYRHSEAEPAVKAFPWSDDEGALIGLQRKDGVILRYARREDASDGEPALDVIDESISVPGLNCRETGKTLTASPDHSFFCWAEKRSFGILVMKYDLRESASSEVCSIRETGLSPDYMICVGSEQASRREKGLDFGASGRDGSLLMLTAVDRERTRLFQIRLPQSSIGRAQVTAVTWYDGKAELINDYKVTQRPYNRINAMSFSGDHMLLAASDGHLYHFVYDDVKEHFVPDTGMPRVKLARATFAVEDVLYLSRERIAAVTIDRVVHLIDARSMFEVRKLRGYFDGLRRLLPIGSQMILATSYDGAVLELVPNGERWSCRDKLPVGEWCWALENIDGSVYAAGYLSGLALIDLEKDEILYRISGLDQKLEHLLYLPEAGDRLLAISKNGVKVFRVAEENGQMRLDDCGDMKLPVESPCCYWSLKSGDTVYLALCDANEGHPQIACFDASMPPEKQIPTVFPTGSDYGRIRDLHLFGRHLMACGLCGKEKEPQVRLYRIGEGPEMEHEATIGGFTSFLVHSAVYDEGGGTWRLAVIDGQSKGELYQLQIAEDADGVPSEERIARCGFPGILCDVAFDCRGDLLLTCLDGGLYRVPWGTERAEELFRNKSYMLTFGADLSDLYQPVASGSSLGRILTDFGNRLSKTKRKFRGKQ